MELYCPECGYEDYDESRYCAMCGALRSPDVPEPAGIGEETGELPQYILLANRYEIQRAIGRGGTAAVYEATDLHTSRRVAIKQLSAIKTIDPQDGEQAVNQFYREAQLLSNLNHPNLPRVTDFFFSSGRYYLVMDFVDGDTLKHILQKNGGPLKESQIITWAIQLCDVLIYLHTQRPPIIFRDLKPSNIMVEQAGQVKLIDFGIARVFKPGKTQDTATLGTLGYAPPEQHGSAQSDPRTDIYALGVTLYELLTSYDPTIQPFSLPSIRKTNPKVTSAMADIIMRAIELSPDARWQSASNMKKALIAYQRGMTGGKSHTKRLPSTVLLTPQRIPLACTLNEAKDRVFTVKRQAVINQLVNSIIETSPFEAKFIALIGYPGVGTSAIGKRVREIVIGRQIGVVVVVNTSITIQVDAIAQFWEEVLTAMKSGDKALDWRMKYAIDSTYHRYLTTKVSGASFKARITSPVTVNFDFGPVKGSFGGTPFEYDRTTEQEPLTEEQSAQQNRRRLFRAIRELMIYLVENHVRVTLFFDRVNDLSTLQQLQPFATIGGLSTVFVTDPDNYETWSQENKDLLKKTIYVECLWDMEREVCRYLTKNCREARTLEYDMFLKTLEFRGRGLPRLVIDELEKYYDDPMYDAGLKGRLGLTNPALVIREDHLMAIRMLGELQQVLEEGWKSLFVDERGVSILDMSKDWARDQAKLGVYKVVGWIIDQASNGQRFRKSKLYIAIASNTRLGDKKSKQIGDNLIEFLKNAGKLRVTAQGLDATGILPPVNLV